MTQIRTTSKWQIFFQILNTTAMIGTFTATMMGAFIAYPEFKALYLSPHIEIKFSSLSSKKFGEPITLEYTLPSSGYYSLWSHDSSGEIKRIYPNFSKTALAQENQKYYKGLRYLKADQRGVEENIILLWAKKESYHPTSKKYANNKFFTQEIKRHKNDVVKRAMASIQIL